MLTFFSLLPTLRVLAVAAALFGSAPLPTSDRQPPPSGEAEKPKAKPEAKPDAKPESTPDVNLPPPDEESPAEDPAKPSDNAAPQESPSAPPAPAKEAAVASAQIPAQLFHGTITHFNAEFVTVSRSLVGKRPESRRFLIIRTTKVHRALHVRAKVTVRYKHLPEGDVALEIQIHPAYAQKS